MISFFTHNVAVALYTGTFLEESINHACNMVINRRLWNFMWLIQISYWKTFILLLWTVTSEWVCFSVTSCTIHRNISLEGIESMSKDSGVALYVKSVYTCVYTRHGCLYLANKGRLVSMLFRSTICKIICNNSRLLKSIPLL